MPFSNSLTQIHPFQLLNNNVVPLGTFCAPEERFSKNLALSQLYTKSDCYAKFKDLYLFVLLKYTFPKSPLILTSYSTLRSDRPRSNRTFNNNDVPLRTFLFRTLGVRLSNNAFLYHLSAHKVTLIQSFYELIIPEIT